MNLSFQSENNNSEISPEEPPKNPYITKDHVPELYIIDKNILTCDKKRYDIKDYYQKINDISDELLDDLMIYNHCGKCQKDLNKYFCINCQENICDKCYENCNIKKHDFKNLDKLKKESNSYYIRYIKDFLNNNIIPIKENDENNIQEENNEDILLIVEIISQDYINFFHFENIEAIFRYIKSFYINNYFNQKYEGFGKVIFENGNYFIGQFKDDFPNGKGTIYYKNGTIMYEGDFINGKAEGNGKLIYKDGNYFIGQFKNDIPNGKGVIYDKKEVLNMKVILQNIKKKVTGDQLIKMGTIIQANLEMVWKMEKENYMIKMEIYAMKESLLMAKQKGLEK